MPCLMVAGLGAAALAAARRAARRGGRALAHVPGRHNISASVIFFVYVMNM